MKQRQATRWFLACVSLVLLLLLVGLLTACDVPPLVDERCYDDYENFSFYEIEREGPLGSVQTAYMFQTPYGDIEVTAKVFENAMSYEYAEICYSREDGVAKAYLYTKKGQNLAPEPIVVTEYVDREVEVQVPVYTHEVVSNFTVGTEPLVVYPMAGVAWVFLPVTPLDGPGMETGDLLQVIWLFDSNIVADDTVWLAQVNHLRNGITLRGDVRPENWVPTTHSDLPEYLAAWLTLWETDRATQLQTIWEVE